MHNFGRETRSLTLFWFFFIQCVDLERCPRLLSVSAHTTVLDLVLLLGKQKKSHVAVVPVEDGPLCNFITPTALLVYLLELGQTTPSVAKIFDTSLAQLHLDTKLSTLSVRMQQPLLDVLGVMHDNVRIFDITDKGFCSFLRDRMDSL